MELTPEILAKILALKEGEEYWINKSEGGGSFLKRRNGYWFDLYEVPQYGGEERFFGCYREDELNIAFSDANSWT
jgi:hypothetical protein